MKRFIAASILLLAGCWVSCKADSTKPMDERLTTLQERVAVDDGQLKQRDAEIATLTNVVNSFTARRPPPGGPDRGISTGNKLGQNSLCYQNCVADFNAGVKACSAECTTQVQLCDNGAYYNFELCGVSCSRL
jgi:hypothetical protein